MAEPNGVVVSGGVEGFTQEITAGRHHLVADEPVDVGGSDRGPGPYELLLAALGSCMSMTIALYARRKAIPLRRVVIQLSHSRDYENDCENCMTEDRRLDRVRIRLELSGDFSTEQRAKLVEIAHKCPVHRTLSAGIKIQIEA
ncbi:MAG TPA: OsmC family protein [Gemmatimonadales bacterium]|jgi:putative redox protein